METLRAPKVREDSVSDNDVSASFSPRYKLIRPLKKGGTSQLYLVKDKLCLSSPAVIKVIRKDVSCPEFACKLAVSEFFVACRLSHSNVVNIYNIHRQKASEYLVMEYLEGPSLDELLNRERLNYKQVVALIEPIVSALAHLHGNGVVHCDVKPSNIVIGKNNSPKLIDLANCRQDSNNKTPSIRLKENVYFGFSERYSSPQIINDKPVTTGDDVYSLAIVIYEMLMGSLPTANAKDKGFSSNAMSKPESINHWQWAVLKKAMSANQEDRYPSVSVFFRRFCRARHITYVVSGSVVSSICLLLVVGYLVTQWDEHRSRFLQYQAAQQQLDTIAKTTDHVLQTEPKQRYLQLAVVNELDEFSRRIVLNELYEAVVFPITNQVDASLLSHASSGVLGQLLDDLNVLGFYYPRSKEISASLLAIKSERNSRQQGVLIAVNELLDSEHFDVLLANEINNVAAINREQWPQVMPIVDLAAYISAVEMALGAEDWLVAIQLFQFGDAIGDSLPAAMDVWSSNAEVAGHVENFSKYLSSGNSSASYFPSESADYFFAERLGVINESLDKVWFNKDIQRYSSELFEIKSEYKIPENYQPYQKTYQLLVEKIDNKIRYHRRSGQRQSVQYLVNLKNTLS